MTKEGEGAPRANPHHPLHLARGLSQQAEGVKADRARPVAAKRAKRLDALGFPLRKTQHGVKWENEFQRETPCDDRSTDFDAYALQTSRRTFA
jgi:hypothetical protein